MKWFLMVMMFSGFAQAKSGINIEYGEDGKETKNVHFELNQKDKVFSFDELSTMCEMKIKGGSLIVFCDHKDNGSGSVTKCNGDQVVLIFQNKKKNKKYIANIKCEQDKI